MRTVAAAIPVAIALFAAACIPITPEPSMPTRQDAAPEPAAPEPSMESCLSGHLGMLPGQSVRAPVSNDLPGYVDIVGVESSLEGEILTATFYLRGLPAELTFNREGVERNFVEYGWRVEIDVEEESSVKPLDFADYPTDYILGVFAIFSQGYWLEEYPADEDSSKDPSPITHAFGDLFHIDLLKLGDDFDGDSIEITSVDGYAKFDISFEENSITLKGKVPGITPNSVISFVSNDYLHGHDSFSCGSDPTAH